MNPLQGVLIVLEAVAASVLLPPMAWLLARTYRRSAAGRRLVWVTAFAMLLGLPLLAMIAPSLNVIAAPAPAPLVATAPVAVAPVSDAGPSGLGLSVLILLAGAVWLAGLATIGLLHLFALGRLEWMRRRARPWRMPVPVPVRGCALLVSERCPGPMTWGVVRPVIMLPAEARGWPTDRLATVLRHEMAHVRRRDGLAQALAVIACALYWPNPLVWGAARALRREAELAADDAVIAAGVLPSDYAGQLLALAAEWSERSLAPTGLAMAAPPALSRRVQSILSTDAIRTGATAMDALKLVLLGGAATAALTLARPSVAEVPSSTPALGPAPKAQTVQTAPAQRQDIQLAQQDAPAPPAAAAKTPPPFPGSPGSTVVGMKIKGKDYSFTAITPEQSAELAKIGPAINKAVADAHIDEAVEKALAAQDPKTRALIAKQLADLGPSIQRAAAAAAMNDAVQQHLAELPPEAQEAFKKHPFPAFPPVQTTTVVPYNAATDDPASPGFIAPGQPDAQHPVPAKLATLLNSRKAKDGVPGANQPWILSWCPAGSACPPPSPAAAPAGNAPAPNPNAPQAPPAVQAPKE